MKKIYFFSAFCLLALLSSCNDDDNQIIGSIDTSVTEGTSGEMSGFYLLNEGSYGSNNASIDYFDATTGTYQKNIYSERNPQTINGLGDTGNDLKIYDNRLYAVMNGSHKVEVMTADSAIRIGEVDIPNGRYICFEGDYAYVSSYVSATYSEGNVLGAVYKFNTSTLDIIDSVTVGYQPEEMAVVDNKLYVANSGGYLSSTYDNRVSVIDLNSFTVTKSIDVAINLYQLKYDNKGHLYVSSRGNYYDIAANLYVIDTQNDIVVDTLNIGASNLCMVGDSAYIYSSEWNYTTYTYDNSYYIINLNTREVSQTQFITDGTEIISPYGMAVNPSTKEVYMTDALDYFNSGTIYCFNPDGTLKWMADTGVCPGHFAIKY
ncbi:MAG: YncE family protein [Porphyromonadaceae bacterium]|nr:YncE family protein [Porphyromonadaceae bacterium]